MGQKTVRRTTRVTAYVGIMLIAVILLLETAAYTFPASFLAPYFLEEGYTMKEVGLVFSAYSAGALVVFHLPGILVRAFGDEFVLVLSGCGTVVALAIPGFFLEPWILGVCRFVQGALGATMWAATYIYAIRLYMSVQDPDGKNNPDVVMSFVTSISPVGTCLGPVLGTVFSEVFGADRAYLGMASVLLLVLPLQLFMSLLFKCVRLNDQWKDQGGPDAYAEMSEDRGTELLENDCAKPPGMLSNDSSSTAWASDNVDVKVVKSSEPPTSEVAPTKAEGSQLGGNSLLRILTSADIVSALSAIFVSGAMLTFLEPVLVADLVAVGVEELSAKVYTTSFFAVLSAAKVVSSLPVGCLSGRIPNRWFIIFAGWILTVGSLAAFPFLNFWPAIAFLALPYGIVINMLQVPAASCVVVYAQRVTGRDENPEIYSMFVWVFSFGMCIGPLMSSSVYHMLSFDAIFAVWGVIVLVWGVVPLSMIVVDHWKSHRHNVGNDGRG